ncbi:DUF2326 domain-containing protein [Vibrio splendidus]|uniref:DUF2326 domain-containing protein n=1 Tax=Vibrio splendidus TaxID=29497 RepID=UPI0034A0C234
MQLINLDIKQDNELIRNIPFKDGINIITNHGSIGNQLGKSTTLRIIKFCLGSKGESIWIDPDSGTTNEDIKKLVTSGTVSFELLIKVNETHYFITRRFEKQKSRILRLSTINGKPYNSVNKFKDKLAEIFGHTINKPSFSTVLNRFTRLNKTAVNRMYSYNNTYTSNDEYSLIYSYLFGFSGHSDLEKDVTLKENINQLRNRRSSLLNGNTEIEYQDKLISIDGEISSLLMKEETYDIEGIHTSSLEKLKHCREEVSRLSMDVAQLDTRIYYSKKTISDYKSKKNTVDSNSISTIYNEAKAIIPNLSVSFTEAMNFHNKLLDKKSQFVSDQLQLLIDESSLKNNALKSILAQEKQLFKDVSNDNHMTGFILIERELQEKRELRGQISFILDEINRIDLEIVENKKERVWLKQVINGYLHEFSINLSTFNNSFKEITLDLFKDYYLLMNAPTDFSNPINFSIVNEDKLAGDGCPRAGSMAIDMAFVNYAKLSNSKLPQFTLQDYLEATDEDKLFSLFKLANKMKIQTIVSILNDKLQSMEPNFIEDNSILTLDVDNKLFRV